MRLDFLPTRGSIDVHCWFGWHSLHFYLLTQMRKKKKNR